MLLDQKDSIARQKPDQQDVPLVLADVTPEVFMNLLEFLYTNTCTLNSKNVSKSALIWIHKFSQSWFVSQSTRQKDTDEECYVNSLFIACTPILCIDSSLLFNWMKYLLSKETVQPYRWGSKTQRFGIKWMCRSEVTTIRLQIWHFNH